MVVYGDVLFRRYILDGLLDSTADITIVVDASTRTPPTRATWWPPTGANRAYLDDAPALLTGIGGRPGRRPASGSA